MKGIVVYFSMGGNTKKIAKAIYHGMKAVIEADIGSMRETSPQDLIKYDLVGVGSPIWFRREPAVVSLFLNNMPKMERKYFFMFCTHGTLPFWIFAGMARLIRKRGGRVIGWADWYGPGYLLHTPYPHPAYGHPDKIDLKEARDFGRQMAERALQIASGRIDLIPDIPKGRDAPRLFRPYPLSISRPELRVKRKINRDKCRYPSCTICQDVCPAGVIDLLGNQPFKEGCWNESLCDRVCPYNAIEIEPKEIAYNLRTQFKIDMTKCDYPSCKLCTKYCPMNSIDFTTIPPTFKYNCEGCDFCWAICPKGAIEATNLEQRHILHYKQTVLKNGESVIIPILKEDEAKGRFRPLIPYEKIGLNTPLYTIKKTPRLTPPEDP